MKFYVVGFTRPHYGDALVYASSNSEALSKVRASGHTPNPGDRYLLPPNRDTSKFKDYLDIHDYMLEEAKESSDGVYIIWEDKEGRRR